MMIKSLSKLASDSCPSLVCRVAQAHVMIKIELSNTKPNIHAHILREGILLKRNRLDTSYKNKNKNNKRLDFYLQYLYLIFFIPIWFFRFRLIPERCQQQQNKIRVSNIKFINDTKHDKNTLIWFIH